MSPARTGGAPFRSARKHGQAGRPAQLNRLAFAPARVLEAQVMPVRIPITEFAPAERVSLQVVRRQRAAFQRLPPVGPLLDTLRDSLFVLNEQRQIVFASENVVGLLAGGDSQKLLGKRFGEALGCVHAEAHPGGCGTSRFCADCGAVQAVLAALAGNPETKACQITRVLRWAPETLDLRVVATPFVHEGERFVVLSVADLRGPASRQGRKQSAGPEAAARAGRRQGAEVGGRRAPRRGSSGVRAGHLGRGAPAGAPKLEPVPLNALELVCEVVQVYRHHWLADHKQLVVEPGSRAVRLVSDRTLLKRFLGNLLEDVLEASEPGHTITLGCAQTLHGIRFAVGNRAACSSVVEGRVLEHSFAQTAAGPSAEPSDTRGLIERHLHATLGFNRSVEGGTTFHVTVPVAP